MTGPPLSLEVAAELVARLGEIDVNTMMLSVPGEGAGPREHHVAIAPHQNLDVMAMVDVLRKLGYSLHFIELSGENEPKGFVITPPPPPLEDAEEIIPDPTEPWPCAACGYFNHPQSNACQHCLRQKDPRA